MQRTLSNNEVAEAVVLVNGSGAPALPPSLGQKSGAESLPVVLSSDGPVGQVTRANGTGGAVSFAVQGSSALSIPATIASGASTSGWIDLGSATLVRIMLPNAWTGTDITLSVAADAAGSDADDLYDASGNEYRIRNCAASRAFNLPPSDTYGIRYVRLRSGTSAAPVAQAAARSITLICKP